MPLSKTLFPASACPKQPSRFLKAGREVGSVVEAAGWPYSRSKTTTCIVRVVLGERRDVRLECNTKGCMCYCDTPAHRVLIGTVGFATTSNAHPRLALTRPITRLMLHMVIIVHVHLCMCRPKGLASRGNSTYRRSLVVEKTALRASPALLPLMSTLYVCCSNRSLAMLVSSSTIRLPFCPHRHSLRASPGSVFTAHSAASVPKSFFHRHVLPVYTVTVCLSRHLMSFNVSKAVTSALSTHR